MSRLIDADKLESGEVIIPTENGGYEYVEVFYKDDVDNALTVDAVEVVRCKDCRYYDAENHNCLDELGYARIWEEDDYCSFAERREER